MSLIGDSFEKSAELIFGNEPSFVGAFVPTMRFSCGFGVVPGIARPYAHLATFPASPVLPRAGRFGAARSPSLCGCFVTSFVPIALASIAPAERAA